MDAVTSPWGGLAVWDIVRVAFPYADEATSRRRPALVVAVPEAHDQLGIVWVLMITSARHMSLPFDVPVCDLRGTGLSHACVVRVTKVAVLDARLAERIGALGVAGRDAVRGNMLNLLIGGLGRA
jgi:mRNA interferase MazF